MEEEFEELMKTVGLDTSDEDLDLENRGKHFVNFPDNYVIGIRYLLEDLLTTPPGFEHGMNFDNDFGIGKLQVSDGNDQTTSKGNETGCDEEKEEEDDDDFLSLMDLIGQGDSRVDIAPEDETEKENEEEIHDKTAVLYC